MNLESLKSKEESAKSKETEKIITATSNNKKRKTRVKGKVKKTQKQIPVKAVKEIFHMKLNLLIH